MNSEDEESDLQSESDSVIIFEANPQKTNKAKRVKPTMKSK